MNDRRQLIFDAVLTRLRSIRVAAGYASDLGTSVFAWRDTAASPFSESELPAANVRDPSRKSIQITTSQHQHNLQLEVDIACAAALPDQVLRTLLADVECAVGQDTRWIADGQILALRTLPTDDQIDTAQQAQTIGGARYRFEIEYRTTSFDPYTPAPNL
jgi:hypothetical protein